MMTLIMNICFNIKNKMLHRTNHKIDQNKNHESNHKLQVNKKI
jgi:hypothetical protein